MTFHGILFNVNKASNKAPAGARGHRILLRECVIKDALVQLIGKPIWMSEKISNKYSKNLRCHSTHTTEDSAIIGYIKHTKIIRDKFIISGPIVVSKANRILTLQASQEILGLSYDATACLIDDLNEEIWRCSAATFIGVNVLPQHTTAYSTDTLFWIED
jgi:hypothetical protein